MGEYETSIVNLVCGEIGTRLVVDHSVDLNLSRCIGQEVICPNDGDVVRRTGPSHVLGL